MKIGISAVPVAGLLLAGAAMAQAAGNETGANMGHAATGEAFVTMQGSDQTLGSDMMDMAVVGPAGEDIGTVTDLLIAADHRIVGLVVTTGGVLGLGGKEVAVPLGSVSLRTQDDERVVMLPQTKEALEAAPAFKTAAELRDERERSLKGAPPSGGAPTSLTPPAAGAR